MKKNLLYLLSPISLILTIFLFSASMITINSQTFDHPIIISVFPSSAEISSAQSSAILVQFKVPMGYWLGSNDRSARNPAPTIISMKPIKGFTFGEAQFPQTVAKGVPVHKGYSYVFDGIVTAVIPFKVSSEVKEGSYDISVFITYTPGLNAGQLRTHIDEEYKTKVVIKNTAVKTNTVPSPSLAAGDKNFFIREQPLDLDEPWKTLLYSWREETPVPEFLHWLWIDPENHGKHIQTAWAPFIGNTENNGFTYGGSIALFNLTPENIMTGLFQFRALHNEIFKTNFALEIVTCPAAYFNYWFSGELSTNGENKQLHFHMENLTLGKKDRFGYELQLDVFKDPRFRFYGLGPGTKEEDKTIYTHSETSAVLDFYWLPADHIRFAIGGKVSSVAVNDGPESLRGQEVFTITQTGPGGKFAQVPGIKGATVYGERLSFVYDGRNSEFMPTDGFYAKVTAEYNQITNQVQTAPVSISNYGKFLADFRKYFSTADQKFTLLFRNSWILTTSKYVPYFDQGTLGGDNSNRGFDKGRFFGQHSVFASMELRYQFIQMDILGTPMTIELTPFVDFGQVFDSDGFNGVFNVNPGMGMRLLNKPNVGVVTAMALGQDGIVLTGGVQLPF